MEGKIKTEPTAIAVIVLFGIHAFRGAIESDMRISAPSDVRDTASSLLRHRRRSGGDGATQTPTWGRPATDRRNGSIRDTTDYEYGATRVVREWFSARTGRETDVSPSPACPMTRCRVG